MMIVSSVFYFDIHCDFCLQLSKSCNKMLCIINKYQVSLISCFPPFEMMILVFYWKLTATLTRCLILHGRFVYAVTPVSPYFLSVTQSVLYHQKHSCKSDFMFFVILLWYFRRLVQLCLIFKWKFFHIAEQVSPYFLVRNFCFCIFIVSLH